MEVLPSLVVDLGKGNALQSAHDHEVESEEGWLEEEIFDHHLDGHLHSPLAGLLEVLTPEEGQPVDTDADGLVAASVGHRHLLELRVPLAVCRASKEKAEDHHSQRPWHVVAVLPMRFNAQALLKMLCDEISSTVECPGRQAVAQHRLLSEERLVALPWPRPPVPPRRGLQPLPHALEALACILTEGKGASAFPALVDAAGRVSCAL
mmetsp:Transcript_22060/g.66273  ORF Transcript_22060/g.66273 Transcript_22060/m.66273 type:complete len:207 (-) Transcript_22060:206-826(-)